MIAQFELTAGSNPATAIAIYEEWARVDRGEKGRVRHVPVRKQKH